MKVVDIKIKELNSIQREAFSNAVKENQELNLSYRVVEDDNLVEIGVDGKRTVLRQSRFKTVKLNIVNRTFILGK
ncbi:hypothetical protein HX017_16150 [Myroides marinus]|uniref:Uncharacterized protein n=1 Tax=Myroides marinus TaxID=703342 RepID=A0A163ZUT5_9FLAO|nr:hypothetical protein [Myroides marinus]KUF42887.1 hypothetical protein AS361_05855 [Myroides marinus]KZE82467.1 hypothetical protein AV926_07140 [Myroides marinus]MDM1348831.1 hypothetical protein [Myroides marinus]MDM1352001.1 hypothetical protein [Myroides marinus]MDM1355911.1 hypothetical protein [Myroides marinus]